MTPPSPDPSRTLRYRLLRSTLRFLFRLLARLDIQGERRVPQEGAVLLAANHSTIFEGPFIFAFAERHPMSALAKMEYKDSLVGTILAPLDPIYIHRGEVDRTALKEMLRRLKGGAAVGIAPEGTRSRTGRLLPGKEGAAYLALQTDAWVQPIAVWGQERVISDLKRFRRPTIHMRLGEPFKLDKDPAKGRTENIEAGTERIMHAIARLLPPDYRGHYADAVQGPPEWAQAPRLAEKG